MDHPALKAFEQSQMRKEYPYFQSGDTVRVNIRVIEGEKERLQAFEGVVIAKSGSGLGETFKVRKLSYGVGVERTFRLHSPRIDSIKVVRRGHVRRAKLYYLRERVGKGTRIKARKKQKIDLNLMVNSPQDAIQSVPASQPPASEQPEQTAEPQNPET